MDILHGTEAREKIWSLIKDIKFAQLATYDQSGTIFHARPMMAQAIEKFEGTLWFFTGKDSRKVEEIRANPGALLTYSDPSANNYVSISGTAHIIEDKAKIKELWSEGARTWFPGGVGDPNITLIRFNAVEAEFCDAPSSTLVYAYGYIKARLTGEKPSPGEIGRADFNTKTSAA